jgi:hypothetical protein
MNGMPIVRKFPLLPVETRTDLDILSHAQFHANTVFSYLCDDRGPS